MDICCMICFDRLHSKSLIVAIKKCGHCFDLSCLNHWMKNVESCPVCRAVVESKTDILTLHFYIAPTPENRPVNESNYVENIKESIEKYRLTLKQLSEREQAIKITLQQSCDRLQALGDRLQRFGDNLFDTNNGKYCEFVV